MVEASQSPSDLPDRPMRADSPNESGGDPIGFAAAKIWSEILVHAPAAGKLPPAKAMRQIVQTALRLVADDLPVRLSAVSSKLIF